MSYPDKWSPFSKNEYQQSLLQVKRHWSQTPHKRGMSHKAAQQYLDLAAYPTQGPNHHGALMTNLVISKRRARLPSQRPLTASSTVWFSSSKYSYIPIQGQHFSCTENSVDKPLVQFQLYLYNAKSSSTEVQVNIVTKMDLVFKSVDSAHNTGFSITNLYMNHIIY